MNGWLPKYEKLMADIELVKAKYARTDLPRAPYDKKKKKKKIRRSLCLPLDSYHQADKNISLENRVLRS